MTMPVTIIMIEDDEIESVQVESTHTIEIDTFVPAVQIDKRYFDAPYYIVPNDNVGQEAFAVIREAMKGQEMVALGRVVMAKRERVIALEAEGKGLLGMTLRYPYEVRDTAAYFDDIPEVTIPGEMLQLAEHILDSKTADFDPSRFEDHYETALIEMLRLKQAGVAPTAAPAPSRPSNVVNLMEALKRSIAQEKGAAQTPNKTPAPKVQKRASKVSAENQRKAPQFKLPITGGKSKQVEEVAKVAPRRRRSA